MTSPACPKISISLASPHSYPYVAAIISDREECGIDLQVWKTAINSIAHMFLSDAEQALCDNARMLTLAWSVKEAAYKWWGRRSIEFIRDLPIEDIVGDKTDMQSFNPPEHIHVTMQCINVRLSPQCLLYEDFALAYITQQHPQGTDGISINVDNISGVH